jgi:hypothetical protein
VSTAVVAQALSGKAVRGTWAALAAGETGVALELGASRNNIVMQATGTFNTETVSLEGSMDGTTWFALTTEGTTPVAVTTDDIVMVFESVRFIRPVVSAGAGVTIKVIIEGLGYA